ncbi:hypothetical protein JAB8_37940 [Janthinobacterium sp. HH106]|uniref:hypothetical protein n=1 Tax=Janthinobacterium sp. HH106 TaxID=1537278 RepID=UPI000892C27D|nr:hypothetical protein [Janthinobacterium sp. HH106]OEZ85612.1 hypothetical protein JAB8_37940 [Janthinobacterium sp. HH106]
MNGPTSNASIDAVNAVEVAERMNWQAMRAGQAASITIDIATLEFLPSGPHQVAAMANLGAELLQEIQAYRPQFLFKRSPAEIVGALIEETHASTGVPPKRIQQDDAVGFAVFAKDSQNVRVWFSNYVSACKWATQAGIDTADLVPLFTHSAPPPKVSEGHSALLDAIRGGVPLEEPVSVGKAMMARRPARVVLDKGIGPLAAVHLVNIGVGGWVHTEATATAYADGFNRGAEWLRSSIIEYADKLPPASAAERDVMAERNRQIKAKCYDLKHDDEHQNDEIAAYATFYAMPPAARSWPAEETGYGMTRGHVIVPADWGPPKACDRRQELVKAAALLVAEIERLDRAKKKGDE